MKHKSYVIFGLYLFCACNNSLKAQQIQASDLPRIFGESNLAKYDADTLITSLNRKVIYSGIQHKITGYDEKGQQIWSKTLTEKQGGLIALCLYTTGL
jgi:hypothetical protein